MIHGVSCYLGLSQYKLTIQNNNLLDLISANFSDVNITISNLDLVEPSLVIDLYSTFLSSCSQCPPLFRNHAGGYYVLLYKLLIFTTGLAFTVSRLLTLLPYSLTQYLLCFKRSYS
jgi:hypothetical protein